MLMGVLYWAWMMVALPPGPFTSMGLWVEMVVSFRTAGLKPGLWGGGGAVWEQRGSEGEECEGVEEEGQMEERIQGKRAWEAVRRVV